MNNKNVTIFEQLNIEKFRNVDIYTVEPYTDYEDGTGYTVSFFKDNEKYYIGMFDNEIDAWSFIEEIKDYFL